MKNFFIEILIILIAKIKTSGDDIIWLPPFIRKHKYSSSFYYLLAISLVIFISWFSVKYIRIIVANDNYLAIFSSIALILFSITFLRNQETNEEFKTNNTINKNVFYISIIGSIDEFFVFTAIFATRNFSIVPTMLGVFGAGMIVILFSFGLNSINWFVNRTKNIKSWIIILIVGILSLIFALCNELKV